MKSAKLYKERTVYVPLVLNIRAETDRALTHSSEMGDLSRIQPTIARSTLGYSLLKVSNWSNKQDRLNRALLRGFIR